LVLGRNGIQHVRNQMVPTLLLGRGRLLLAERCPDAEVAVRNRTVLGPQPAGAQIAQYGSP
jgi:hypothetical protein